MRTITIYNVNLSFNILEGHDWTSDACRKETLNLAPLNINRVNTKSIALSEETFLFPEISSSVTAALETVNRNMDLTLSTTKPKEYFGFLNYNFDTRARTPAVTFFHSSIQKIFFRFGGGHKFNDEAVDLELNIYFTGVALGKSTMKQGYLVLRFKILTEADIQSGKVQNVFFNNFNDVTKQMLPLTREFTNLNALIDNLLTYRYDIYNYIGSKDYPICSPLDVEWLVVDNVDYISKSVYENLFSFLDNTLVPPTGNHKYDSPPPATKTVYKLAMK